MSCVYDQDGVQYDDQTGAPCGSNPSIYQLPPIQGPTVYGGGTPVPTGGVFNTTVAAILSGLAILTKAPYIPTANNPYNQPSPTIIAGGLNRTGASGVGVGANNASVTAGTVGKVETWIKANPGASAIIALVAGVMFFGPAMQKGGR